jgi:MoaA/NifB/PqqE/SkfB family radical SAM enzyme
MIPKNIKKIYRFLNSKLYSKKTLFYWSKKIEMNIFGRIKFFYPKPRNIHVAVSNKCNLRCVMCPYHSPLYENHHTSDYFKSAKVMSKEIFEKILNYASKNSINLQFGQIEEPLLHPEIFFFLKKAKDEKIPFVHMTTNGTLLTEENAEKLSQTGINSVMFSLDAASPETYKKNSRS